MTEGNANGELVRACGAAVPAGTVADESMRNRRRDACTTMSRRTVDLIDPRQTPLAPVRDRGELPHLYKEGGSYFVTFRLWDAIIPREQRAAAGPAAPPLARQNLHHRNFARTVAEATEPPLQLGSCLLARPELATIVQEAVLHFDGQRYQLAAWCVMPNHVHVAYTALGVHTPEDIHHSWKSYTSHRISRALGRHGRLWERESFDHLIRSVDHYEAYVEYIETNPVAAGLCSAPAEWPFGSAAYFARSRTS